MSIYRTLQILAALSFWTSIALSQTMPARTVSAMISAASSTPTLQQCDSICALMAYPIHGSDSSLFASYCEGTERTDCGVNEMQFKIDLIGAGQTLSFECTCNLPPLKLTSSQLPTAGTTTVGSSSPTTTPVSKTTTASLGITSTAFSSVSPLTSSLSSTATPTTTSLTTSTNTSITTSVPTVSPTKKATESNTSAKSTLSPVTKADKASPGTIVGIVIGVLCILACLGAGALTIYRRRQKRKIDQGYIESFRACSAMPGSV